MAIPEPRWMTYGEAKGKLRRYYSLLDALKEITVGKASNLAVVGDEYGHSAPCEAAAIARAYILERVQDVRCALAYLSEQQRRFAELRYGQDWGYRSISRDIGVSLGGMAQFETEMLAQFIGAMGYIPVRSKKS